MSRGILLTSDSGKNEVTRNETKPKNLPVLRVRVFGGSTVRAVLRGRLLRWRSAPLFVASSP